MDVYIYKCMLKYPCDLCVVFIHILMTTINDQPLSCTKLSVHHPMYVLCMYYVHNTLKYEWIHIKIFLVMVAYRFLALAY